MSEEILSKVLGTGLVTGTRAERFAASRLGIRPAETGAAF